MKHVRVTMSDETFASLLTRAVSEGFPDVASYLLSLNGLVHPLLTEFTKLRAAFDSLPSGTEVTVKTLGAAFWSTLPVGSRTNLGKMFHSAASNGLVQATVRRDDSNHFLYTRTSHAES